MQEIDDLPDDLQLRTGPDAQASPPVTAGGPAFVTPRTALQIKVAEPDDEEELEEDPNVKISEMAEQVDNPYLLHYKNQTQILKAELMGPTSVPTTPSNDPQRDPEEEFFMLAVLALKMLHNE